MRSLSFGDLCLAFGFQCCCSDPVPCRTSSPAEACPFVAPVAPLWAYQDSLAEWSKAVASGASPQGRGFEPHSCQSFTGTDQEVSTLQHVTAKTCRRGMALPPPLRLPPCPHLLDPPPIQRARALRAGHGLTQSMCSQCKNIADLALASRQFGRVV